MDSNHILDRLDAEAKRDILHAEQFEKFQLGPPTYLPDDLDEATTNDSIEIELVPEVALAMEHLDNGPVSFENG